MYIAYDKNAINSECPFFVIYRIHVNAMYIAFRLWDVGAKEASTANPLSQLPLSDSFEELDSKFRGKKCRSRRDLHQKPKKIGHRVSTWKNVFLNGSGLKLTSH